MNREALSNAVFWVGIAFVVKYVDIRVGINLLPDWLAFGILLWHMGTLAEARPTVALLGTLGKLLLVWELLKAICALFGNTLAIGGIDLMAGVLWMYMQFQLLTDLAEIAKDCEYPGSGRLLQLRTVMTLVGTVGALPVDWSSGMHLYLLGAVFVVTALWLFKVLFDFSGYLHSPTKLSEIIPESEE